MVSDLVVRAWAAAASSQLPRPHAHTPAVLLLGHAQVQATPFDFVSVAGQGDNEEAAGVAAGPPGL